MQEPLTRKGNIKRRATKEAADEAVKAAGPKPFLDLSGDLSEYRLKVSKLPPLVASNLFLLNSTIHISDPAFSTYNK